MCFVCVTVMCGVAGMSSMVLVVMVFYLLQVWRSVREAVPL